MFTFKNGVLKTYEKIRCSKSDPVNAEVIIDHNMTNSKGTVIGYETHLL